MKNRFRVMDSDLHTMEPDGLWEKYLEPPFKKFAPTFARKTENASNQPLIGIGNLEIGEMSKRTRTAVVGKDLQGANFDDLAPRPRSCRHRSRCWRPGRRQALSSRDDDVNNL